MGYQQDDRQILHRAILQQLYPWVGSQTLDMLMASANADLTSPLKVDAQNPTSLTVNVGGVIVPNPVSSRNKSISFINNALPIFAGGTVTFPSTSGGNITASTGGSFPLVLPSNNYVQVVLALDATGNIQATIGIPNAVLASALVPAPLKSTLPFAYVTVFNNAGTISNIAQNAIYQFAGSGGANASSGGLTNYIGNPDAESNTFGWVLYSNPAANTPTTGTGGSPAGLTFVRSTVSPLIGSASFLLTQANSTNVQGEGVSYDFTIDPAYQANILAVSFNYNASNTFQNSDGFTTPNNDGTTSFNSGNSDVEVFIYDKTNNILLPVVPEVIVGKGTNNFSFAGIVQMSPNSTSYRLIFHVATSNMNATGWALKFDNVFVGPQILGIGATSITPTVSVATASTFTGGFNGTTYTPPVGCSYIEVEMVGGGGGGGQSAQSGNAAGGAGGVTTFGSSLLTANGGGGGDGGNASGNGGVGGTATVNAPAIQIVAVKGGNGSSTEGTNGSSNARLTTGPGGNSPFGGAGSGSLGSSTPAAANSGSGGGGGGQISPGDDTGASGGAGGYLKAIIVSPTGYTYSVGAAGSGAGNGSSGGGGIIIVREYYFGAGTQGGSGVGTKPTTVQVLTASSGTYNTPVGVSYIKVKMVGAGGGGGGGSASSGTAVGGTGGQTTFGTSFLITNGGLGGAANSVGGVGGTAVALPLGVPGISLNGGQGDAAGNSVGSLWGGNGASSPFGGSGGGGNGGGGSAAIPSTGSGGGGAGNSAGTGFPGTGGGSGSYIEAVITNPASSYPYVVGSGGGGGSNQQTGGSGGSGIIVIEEYYSNVNSITNGSPFPNAPTTQVLSGSGTYTLPSNPTPLYIEVEMIGGGGSGQGSVNNGGLFIGGVGTNGTQTTFGSSFLTANGGLAANEQGGSGGTATIGAGAVGIAIQGASGESGASNASTGYASGAAGASSPFGGGGGGGGFGSGGNQGVLGAGGGGGSMNAGFSQTFGGAGGGAGGYLKAIIHSPASSYAYSVGNGGTGGTGVGSGSSSGGNGGNGTIIVREYYANIFTSAPGASINQPPVIRVLNGSGTYQAPFNTSYIKVKMAGGGGGGGSNAGTGTSGTTTMFGTVLTANGGTGGSTSGGGTGGTATIGAGATGFPVSGGNGGGGGLKSNSGSGGTGDGGTGGANPLGGAGGAGGAQNNAGAGINGGAGTPTTGAGGGGGAWSNTGNVGSSGGGGGAGAYIEAIIANPTIVSAGGMFTYSVGNGGTGAGGGSFFSAGGNGATGTIIIEEHYVGSA